MIYRRAKSRHILRRSDDENISSELQVSESFRRSFMLLSLWFSIASFTFSFVNDWSVSSSIFYATQTGLSIGFNIYDLNTTLSKVLMMIHLVVSPILVLYLVRSLEAPVRLIESSLVAQFVITIPSLKFLIYSTRRYNGILLLCVLILQ